MSQKQTVDLAKILQAFDADVKNLVGWLRDFTWGLCPEANELIYDNYNAVAFTWSLTDKLGNSFCNVSIYRTNQNIHFGFYRGNELSDPDHILLGKGKQYRYILVTDTATFPEAYIKNLVEEAYAKALSEVKAPKQLVKGQTIIKSVAEKKRTASKHQGNGPK